MDKEGQSEVTNKLRSAIKKKLAEISECDDDELPEYVMILVANQRSKLQIEKDLSLFLRNNTGNFTNWLWDLLNSLNVGSKSNQSSHPRSNTNVPKRKEIEADEDAIVLDCDPDEQEKDFFSHEDTSDSNFSKTSTRPFTSDVQSEVLKETSLLKCRETRVLESNKNKKEQQLSEEKPRQTYQEQSSKEPLSSKVVPVRKRLIDSDDEYDPAKPDYKKTKNATRNYGGPAALQANKLLLKAVDDATKSILDGKSIEDFYKPTPIKVLTSKRFRNELPPRGIPFLDAIPHTQNAIQNEFLPREGLFFNTIPSSTNLVQNKFPLKGGSFHGTISPTENSQNALPPRKDVPQKDALHLRNNEFHPREDSFNPRGDSTLRNRKAQIIAEPDFYSDASQTSGLSEQHYSNVFMAENYMNPPISSHNTRTICLRTIPLITGSPEFESPKYTPRSSPEYSLAPDEEIRPKSPHFIVTLEGVNLASFKRKLPDNSIDSMDEDEEDSMLEEALNDDTSPNKKLKINERCKYWPACKNSDHCSYHHPTVPCKCFPDCKFGDKCLYIHPNCKFDALCSRKDCPFTHASKRKLPLTALPLRMVHVKNPKVRSVCKFFPKCTAKSCSFIHPKLCRYGTACRLPTCLYSHFPLPSRNQLKWQASA